MDPVDPDPDSDPEHWLAEGRIIDTCCGTGAGTDNIRVQIAAFRPALGSGIFTSKHPNGRVPVFTELSICSKKSGFHL